MVQALELDRRLKVLEIGTGSGYQTAVHSYLCRRVYTVERHAEMLRDYERRLLELRRFNVKARPGARRRRRPEQGPFERIVSSAAATGMTSPLHEHHPGGRDRATG